MEQETCFLFFFPVALSEHSKPTKVKKFAKTFITRITLPSLIVLYLQISNAMLGLKSIKKNMWVLRRGNKTTE